jgi:hypothetical protein
MPWELPPQPTDPAERFASIVTGMRKAAADCHVARGVSGPLILLIWNYLGRILNQFAAIAAKVRAGTLPAPRKPRTRAPLAAAEPPLPRKPGKPSLLPRGHLWMIKLFGWHVGNHACLLETLLKDPDMAALIAAAPQLGRLLRPLCRALGRDPGAAALPPRPPSPANLASHGPAAPKLPGRTPRRKRSTAGVPITGNAPSRPRRASSSAKNENAERFPHVYFVT